MDAKVRVRIAPKLSPMTIPLRMHSAGTSFPLSARRALTNALPSARSFWSAA
ncbi:MAG: hypothetical protein PHG00_15215 [Methylococcales bacterium]|nr:hypothetical protein [Methylococcales bacterium]